MYLEIQSSLAVEDMLLSKKNIRIQLLVTVLLFLALPLSVFIALQRQNLRTIGAPGNATLAIVPPSQVINVGDTGTLEIFLNPNGETVSAVEIVLTYGSSVTEVTDVVPGPFFTDEEAGVGAPLVITKKITDGQIHYAVGFPLGSNFGSTNSKTAILMPFKSLASGTSNFSFVTTGALSTTVSDVNAKNVLNSAAGGIVNVSAGARLYFSDPRPANPQETNTSFLIDILANTGGQDAYGVDAKIKFDTTALSVDSVTKPDSPVFASYPALTYDNSAGTVSVSANVGTGSNSSVNASDIVMATISFSTKTVSSGNLITYDFAAGERNDSNIVLYGTSQDADPTDILSSIADAFISIEAGTATTTPVPTLTPTIVPSPTPTVVGPTSIQPTLTPTQAPPSPTQTPLPSPTPPSAINQLFRFAFQGITRSGTDKTKQLSVTYKQIDGITYPQLTVTTGVNGEASISVIPGQYIFLVKAPGYLAKRIGSPINPVSVDFGTSILDFSSIPLLGGDFNSDGEVNEVDYTSQFLTNFRKPNSAIDLDGSGEVNNLDFAIMRANWNLIDDAL